MFVIKDDGTYYMFAEGENDVAHLLTSPDGINWTEQGDLTIITTRGDTLSAPYGTPVIWIENGQWYLFYERNDDAIWLAKSDDKLTWTNVQDEPVLRPGSWMGMILVQWLPTKSLNIKIDTICITMETPSPSG